MTMASDISRAAQILRDGGLVAFPTETVYGLGADATSDAAVARIFAAKQRPQFNPLISHVASEDAAFELGQFSSVARKLATTFWPGPLTIVVDRRKDCPVSLLCSAGMETLALRVPSHPMALSLLGEVKRPIAAPSANRSGRISPTTAEHVRRSLGERVDLILDGGPSTVGLESTVVHFTSDGPVLLRSGGVTREQIEAVLGHRLFAHKSSSKLHSPGMLESHYAPNARLRLNAETPQQGEVYIGFGAYNGSATSLSTSGDLQEASANLFKMLHDVDDSSPEVIAIAPIPHHGLGEAINDRLRRAAAPRSKT
jgi:L-threonylcarbamoyladenylate synthase